jgi:EmrB/QacA subfamily drug resistance transporter
MTSSTGEVESGLGLKTGKGRVALVATVAATAMASLDATVVNVALPHIGAEFHSSVSSLQWVLTGYLLALSSLILLGGALGDRFGRRRILVIGTVWFAGASLLCGVSQGIVMLVVARVLEGVGGALVSPGSLAIIQATYRESDRAAAVGAWSGLGGIAGAVGPFVGGALVGGPGWRWAFLINVPIALVAVVAAYAAVPETRDTDSSEGLDWQGGLIVSAALAAVTWALTEVGVRGWRDPTVLVTLSVGVVLGAGFVRHVLRVRYPLVPPALFRNRTFSVVNLETALLYAGIGVTFFLVIYELQVVAGWSPLKAGTSLLPVTVLMLLLSEWSGALGQRIGPRTQLTLGPLLTGAGLLLLARLGPHTSYLVDVLPGAFVFGLGLVVFGPPLTATVMAAADPDHVSVASGVNYAVARVAGLITLAVIPSVSGLARASNAHQITHAFRIGMVIAAILALLGTPVAVIGLAPRLPRFRTARRFHCAIDGPPMQPDPARCPMPP